MRILDENISGIVFISNILIHILLFLHFHGFVIRNMLWQKQKVLKFRSKTNLFDFVHLFFSNQHVDVQCTMLVVGHHLKLRRAGRKKFYYLQTMNLMFVNYISLV